MLNIKGTQALTLVATYNSKVRRVELYNLEEIKKFQKLLIRKPILRPALNLILECLSDFC